MNRKDYDLLYDTIKNDYELHELDPEHFAINILTNFFIAAKIDIPEPKQPVSEQYWGAKEYDDKPGKFRICDSQTTAILADAYGEEMRDILCGIPGLVKVIDRHLKGFCGHEHIIAALKAMGLRGSDKDKP